jgi:hypothetical protein
MTKQSTNKYLNNTFLDHLTENQHKLEKYALCPCSLYPRISPLGKEINKSPVRNPFQFNGHQTFPFDNLNYPTPALYSSSSQAQPSSISSNP